MTLTTVRAILAVGVLVTVTMLTVVVFTGQADTASKGAEMLLGALIGAFSAVLSFYFGSSSGSERKTDLLAGKDAQ